MEKEIHFGSNHMLVNANFNNFHGVVLPRGASVLFSFCVVCHLGETVKLYSFLLCGALFTRNSKWTGIWQFYIHTTRLVLKVLK
jgi:hypothetical protein